jgi:hypothetical protein
MLRVWISLTFPLAPQLKAKFGSLPNNKAVADRRMKSSGHEKKYFDSADWAKEQGAGGGGAGLPSGEGASGSEPAPGGAVPRPVDPRLEALKPPPPQMRQPPS